MSSSSFIEDTKAIVISHVSQLQPHINKVGEMTVPKGVLMVKPDYYTVDYIINPHMSGNIGTVDKDKAYRQWKAIRETFAGNGLLIHEIDGQPDLPDMVFCANQSLPYMDEEGNKKVIMSRMRSEHRTGEVPFIEQWYRQNGYEIIHIDHNKVDAFEGMGDGIWHHKRRLLWGGYGYRTSHSAYELISREFNVPVITLELKNPSFYHLDTCFCVLDEKSVLIYPEAFTADGLDLIKAVFENVIEADKTSAEMGFACNATSDGNNVVIQKGSGQIREKLENFGFTVQEVDTQEFIKSGGSVFCMKCMIW